ncbi:uncharacterized protein [Narcine bancroftii]
MSRIKGKSIKICTQANTKTNLCFYPAQNGRKRTITTDPKPSSKLKDLSLICEEEEEDSQLSALDKPLPGGCRYLSRVKRITRKKILKKRNGSEPFWNRSPSLQQCKKIIQSNSRYEMCSGVTESSLDSSTLSEAFPFLLPSLDSELYVNLSSSTRTDSCSSFEIFREAEEHTTLMQLEDVASFHCKNSTLLDSSKAVNIDLMAQPSDLSEILEHTGNISRERNFKNHETDATQQYESSKPVLVTVAGKTISKLQPGNGQKRMQAISIPSKQKNICQDDVPVCSIILAPVCYRPAKLWQYEQLQPCSTFDNVPLGKVKPVPEESFASELEGKPISLQEDIICSPT